MSASVKISVCCPVYNGAGPFLTALLESIQAQTFSAWECICVDDGAKDRSQEVCVASVRADARFRVICQRNGGICAGRNRALGAVNGEAFMHVDQDDLLLPRALEALWTGRERSGAKLVIGRMVTFEDALPVLPAAQADECLIDDAWAAEVVGSINNVFSGRVPFPSWNKLYDRSTFVQMRFLPVRYGDDTYYTPLTHFAVKQAYLLGEVTYGWRVGHVSGSSGTCTEAWLTGYSTALAAAAALSSPACVRSDYLKALLRPGKWMARVALRHYLHHPGQVKDAAMVAFAQRLLASALPWPASWRLRLWLLAHRCRGLLRPLCRF